MKKSKLRQIIRETIKEQWGPQINDTGNPVCWDPCATNAVGTNTEWQPLNTGISLGAPGDPIWGTVNGDCSGQTLQWNDNQYMSPDDVAGFAWWLNGNGYAAAQDPTAWGGFINNFCAGETPLSVGVAAGLTVAQFTQALGNEIDLGCCQYPDIPDEVSPDVACYTCKGGSEVVGKKFPVGKGCPQGWSEDYQAVAAGCGGLPGAQGMATDAEAELTSIPDTPKKAQKPVRK